MMLTASSTTDGRLLAFLFAKQSDKLDWKVTLLCAGQVTCRSSSFSSLPSVDRKRLVGLGKKVRSTFTVILCFAENLNLPTISRQLQTLGVGT